mgnify:CR=1 FL=1
MEKTEKGEIWEHQEEENELEIKSTGILEEDCPSVVVKRGTHMFLFLLVLDAQKMSKKFRKNML